MRPVRPPLAGGEHVLGPGPQRWQQQPTPASRRRRQRCGWPSAWRGARREARPRPSDWASAVRTESRAPRRTPSRGRLSAPATAGRRHGLAGLVDCSSSAFPCMSALASHHTVIEPAGQTPHTSPGRAARGRGFDPEDLAASMQEGLCQPGVWARGPDRERQTSWDGRGPGRCQGAGPRGGRRSLGGRGEAWALSPPERAPWASSGSRREAGWPTRGLSLGRQWACGLREARRAGRGRPQVPENPAVKRPRGRLRH